MHARKIWIVLAGAILMSMVWMSVFVFFSIRDAHLLSKTNADFSKVHFASSLSNEIERGPVWVDSVIYLPQEGLVMEKTWLMAESFSRFALDAAGFDEIEREVGKKRLSGGASLVRLVVLSGTSLRSPTHPLFEITTSPAIRCMRTASGSWTGFFWDGPWSRHAHQSPDALSRICENTDSPSWRMRSLGISGGVMV